MGNEVLQAKSQEDKLNYINDTFNIRGTVSQLHAMMADVVKDEINPRTVNAACNCVNALNQTIDMTIKAARFLNEKN